MILKNITLADLTFMELFKETARLFAMGGGLN